MKNIQPSITLILNGKNPEMILPVLPCLLHASWRLMEEMDHIDRLPSSRFNAAKRPYLRDGFIPLYISCQSPMRNSMFHWIKENQVLFLLSSNHPPTHSSQETKVSEGQHKCLQPCSVWNTSTQNPRLLSFPCSVGTLQHTAYQ